MKRLVVVLLAALALTSCGKDRLTAEQTVVECWTRIASGDYLGAVELMESTEEEMSGYVQLLEDKYSAKLEKAGGLVRVDVLASHDKGDTALVQAIVVLGNGDQIEELYALCKIDKEWRLQAQAQ